MPNNMPAVWNLPHPRNPFFTGRAQILDQLHRALTASGKAALSGMGGAGKTQTAVEYAHLHRSEYSTVLWLKADTEDSLKGDLAAVAGKLNLPEKDEIDRDAVVAAVKRWLAGRSGWLLLLDNADDLSLASDLVRREWSGHVLLTTRAYATGGISKVEIREMTVEEGTLFLLRRTKLIGIDEALDAATEADQALAAEITQELGGLPLALDQAGAFIEEKASSFAEYLEMYEKEGDQLRAERAGVISDHEPVTITFSLAFRQVAEANAAAADMLRACAFLSPDAIPEEIFVTGAKELGENLVGMAAGGINLVKMVGEAARFSLIRRITQNRTVEVHRLVQQVIKDEMDEETQRLWAERVVRALNATYPVQEEQNWPLCEKLLPHAQEAARLVRQHSLEFGEAARLLNEAGCYCQDRAQYRESQALLEQSLSIYEKIHGPEDKHLATSLNNLATLYDDQGKYAEAESLYKRALSIREKVLEPEHLDVAMSLNNLAHLYDNQGKYAEAEHLYVRALSIREKVLGPEHPRVATSLHNLAACYRGQGKYAEAEPLYVRALSIREKVLGSENRHVALSLNSLASLYNNQGRYAEAEPLYVRALGIFEKVLGPEHPDVALILNNLAHLYDNQGKYAEAEPLYVRALSIREKVLGPEHPDVALNLNNLAALHDNQGRYAEAEPLYVRALGIFEKVLGPEHPHMALILNNLASLYNNQDKYAEAEPLYVRALSIFKKVLEPEHPSLLVVRKNYTSLLQKMRNNTQE